MKPMRTHKIALPPEVSLRSVAAYSRLYQLETWLREMVYLETKAHFGANWWAEAEQALNRSRAPGIPAEKSITRDKKHPHMSTPENDPLWFLSFDSLLKIIFDDALWPLFSTYLTTKELLQARFTEIAPIRNRVGHNRTLHGDDIDRLRQMLRDLDQGFWRFCTSFNDTYPFVGERRDDPVYQHFRDRMAFDYSEVEPNKWALAGSSRGMQQTVSVEYSYRPSAVVAEGFPEKGRLYHFTFSQTAQSNRHLDYLKIIDTSSHVHPMLVYIILDSFQQQLEVTIPALCPPADIIKTADQFYSLCGNYFTYSYREQMEKQIPLPETDPELFQQYDAVNRAFADFAARWPHYVVPPGNPFAFLGSDCPCSFFEA
jgi:hypothetical protein